jgi:hypothetical protein
MFLYSMIIGDWDWGLGIGDWELLTGNFELFPYTLHPAPLPFLLFLQDSYLFGGSFAIHLICW